MSAPVVTGVAVADALPPPAERPSAVRRNLRGRLGRWLILLIAAIYFIGPLVAAISFTVQDPHGGITFSAYRQIFNNPGTGQITLVQALVYSLEISVVTIVITLALMLPTQLLLHLRLPRMRGVVEIFTLLPLVFPPVVLVVGVSDVYKQAAPKNGAAAGQDEGLAFHVLRYLRDTDHPLLLALLYVMLAMPFVYRAIDAGIRAIDARTLVEASRNLGASWPNVLLRVIMPCLRTSLINASFLCFALVMGEYTISSILLYTKPFPVWLAQLPTRSGQVQAAVSVFSLLLVEVILLAIGALNWRSGREKKR
ncbi:ABC transporter permease [uncultured Jatrophihabitans sp.]|uniref:ABC transporter permease n=1 Tax=uncultured Jatrophihabitans sp. TaxID=1610747 RepID=UPI0035CBA9EF